MLIQSLLYKKFGYFPCCSAIILLTSVIIWVTEDWRYLPQNARGSAHSRDSAARWQVSLGAHERVESPCADRAAKNNSSARHWQLRIPERPSCFRGTQQCRPINIRQNRTLHEMNMHRAFVNYDRLRKTAGSYTYILYNDESLRFHRLYCLELDE